MFTAMFYSAILAVLASAHSEMPVHYLNKSSSIDLCQTPEPECTGGRYVKDPKDCSKFFDCQGGNPESRLECPTGQYFNSILGDAGSYPPCFATSDCEKDCNCIQECLEDGQVYADLQDCGRYYKCVCAGPAGECYSQSETCKQDQYFNGHECGDNPHFCCP